jgi:RNA polymerase sigma factor (sigma-70 family)
MHVPDDLELLRRFARAGDQGAFTQLVARHVDLVYSAALRQVRDPATAEDVTQSVFMALAAKAAGMRAGTIVPGWLLLTTRYLANDALRAARRRARHERVAARQRTADMQHRESTSSAAREAAERDEHSRLEAVLDAVLAKLGTAGRDAIVLRFFEGNSFADVGRRLGISEDAAKKRVGRSLLHLRKLLRRRGLTFGPEGLGPALGAVAVRPAPAALAAKASQAAVTGVSLSMAKGALTIMAWTKAKATATAAAALLLVGGGAAVGWHVLKGRYRGSTQTIVLPPGRIAPAARFTWQDPQQPDGDKTYHGPPIVGIVKTRDGKPVAGATVQLSTWDNSVVFHPSPKLKPAPMTRTGPDGRFEFRPTSMPYGVMATCDQGIGVSSVAKLAGSGDLLIEPWGRIDGTARIALKPLAASRVLLSYVDSAAGNETRVYYNGGLQTPILTDESGHFVIDRLPPGLVDLTCCLPGTFSAEHSIRFHVQRGKTTFITAGGTGRPVIGRINPPPGDADAHIVEWDRLMPEPFHREDWQQLTPEDRARLEAKLEASPGYAAWERDCNPFRTTVGPNGTFRMEDVPAGRYQMRVWYFKRSQSRYIMSIGDLERTVTVDAMPGGRSDDPLDLGTLDLTLHKWLKVGEPAPAFAWHNVDGKASALQSFRGKYVLGIVLRNGSESDDMWEDLLKLKPLYDRFGADPRLVMLGLYAGKGFDAARQSAAHDGVGWPLVNVGDSLDSVPDPYRSSGEMMFVIDPQGAVLAKDLAPQRAWYVLDQTLAHRTTDDEAAKVSIRHVDPGQDPRPLLPPPGDNAAAHATFTIVDGIAAKIPPAVLVSGTLPPSDDAPAQNFCFESGTLEGRLKVDLGRPIEIQQITTISRHKSDRGPQVYALYASDGAAAGFDPAPPVGTDPAARGWTRLASVDTRPASGPRGGTYAATLAAASGNWPRYRYLLFELFPTETTDAFGDTFYSQIHVAEAASRSVAGTARP